MRTYYLKHKCAKMFGKSDEQEYLNHEIDCNSYFLSTKKTAPGFKATFSDGDLAELQKKYPRLLEVFEREIANNDESLRESDFRRWQKEGFKSTSTGLIIAPKDYVEDDKKHFTWDEAMEVTKTKVPMGWRLPTRAEWMHIVAEFGGDVEGDIDVPGITGRLDLRHHGYTERDSSDVRAQGADGYYWSRTAYSAGLAYFLHFYSSFVNPQCRGYKDSGFSVRLVFDPKETE